MSGSRLITAEADKTIKIYKEDEMAVSGGTHTCSAGVFIIHVHT